MSQSRVTHGSPMSFWCLLMVFHGFPIGLPWGPPRVYGSSPWVCHGSAMGLVLACRSLMCLPLVFSAGAWVTHGTPMGLAH